MNRGVVMGEVWATRKVRDLDGHKLLLVAFPPDDRLVVCVDNLGAGVGDAVLVSWGSGARNVLVPGPHNRHVVADAAIAQIVDGSDPEA